MSAHAKPERASPSGSRRCKASRLGLRRLHFEALVAASSSGRLTSRCAVSCADLPKQRRVSRRSPQAGTLPVWAIELTFGSATIAGHGVLQHVHHDVASLAAVATAGPLIVELCLDLFNRSTTKSSTETFGQTMRSGRSSLAWRTA